MPDMQSAARGAKAAGDVPRPVVSEHPPDADAVDAKPPQSPAQKAGDRHAPFVGQEFDIATRE